MSLILAWSKPSLGFIASDRLHTYYNTALGAAPVVQTSGIKLRDCANGYYAVSGSLLSGFNSEGTAYDIGIGAEKLNDPEQIIQSYTEGYLSAYKRVGALVESNQGEAKADLTIVVEDRVRVLEMNGGNTELIDLPHLRFTCSTPADFSGPQESFQQVHDLLLEWVHGRIDIEQAFTEAWSRLLPHTSVVSSEFDVGVTGSVNQRYTFQA